MRTVSLFLSDVSSLVLQGNLFVDLVLGVLPSIELIGEFAIMI